MKRTSTVLTWASLILVVAAVVPAWCAEKSLEKVRVAVSSKSLGFLDVWAARERGFYRKHGIEAEIIAMRPPLDRKSTRLNSSHLVISYAVFCLKKKKKNTN